MLMFTYYMGQMCDGCPSDIVFDVVIDNRKNKKTFSERESKLELEYPVVSLILLDVN